MSINLTADKRKHTKIEFILMRPDIEYVDHPRFVSVKCTGASFIPEEVDIPGIHCDWCPVAEAHLHSAC